MADNDKFRFQIAPCWRKPYDAAKRDASPWEFAQLCGPALAAFFRSYGCPQFEACCAIVEPWCVREGQLPFGGEGFERVCERCEELVRACAGTSAATTAEYVARAAQDLAFEGQAHGCLLGDASSLLARRVCVELVADTLLAKLEQSKVLERFEIECGGDTEAAIEALFSWKDEVAGHLASVVEPIARQLAADPSGGSVRARQVAMPQRSTLELLDSFRMA